ncbi:calcium-binding and coiled-coil domain-containing protein 2 isoform X2 [Toxotes jaculatrix]|uniref:calcium-binding and coiled-coil domain-containing protein 2 isoform X2 n=1 Tax=Toxotes jaculatrix TaxID=941984 RepID=UPI001B3B0ACF|nr:calcium-binding and coiled-coil domain-containing protein 2 isoform X2 [Toxotes jaculatrix]
MESPAEAAAADASARTFSQVVFIDIPHSYPPSIPITCRYTLTAAYQPHSRDWVGIFKVGWSTAKDYHTFVWVEPCLDVVGEQPVTGQVVFKDYYLPKDDIEFYQFCYIDSTGQVRGASTPFCFKNLEEQSMESNPDDDLLVITTQEQVEQSVREKAELQKAMDQIKEENETLKRALQKEQREAATLMEQNEQNEQEKSQLVRELDQIKEQNGNLKSTLQHNLEEINHLKEELLAQKTMQMELQRQSSVEDRKRSQSLCSDGESIQNETHAQEKYDRALMKIGQLKEERKDLKATIDAQNEEIAKFNCKLRDGERELFKAKDSVHLLQFDLQTSEKEKERLSAELQRLKSIAHNMDDVKRENQELCRRLSQQETSQDFSDEDLKVQCKSLVSKLQETQTKLVAEREELRGVNRRAEFLEREVMQMKGQVEKLNKSCDQEERRAGKYELQFREALEVSAEKDGVIEEQEHLMRLMKHENEELTRENQSLRSDIEGLRRALSEVHTASPADPPPMHPDPPVPAGDTSAPEEAENLYETIGGIAEAESLMCPLCNESFPGITPNELEQHKESHRVCPFCTLICDNMEQSVFEDHVYGHEL